MPINQSCHLGPLAGRNPRIYNRTTIFAFGLFLCATLVTLIIGLTSGHGPGFNVRLGSSSSSQDGASSSSRPHSPPPPPPGPPPPKLGLCATNMDSPGAVEFLRDAERKYSHLLDDKFTIAIQTYRRPMELNATLHKAISSNELPSLYEVVVVWNNLEEVPPPDFTSEYGVRVRYRRSPVNSLNEKFKPDPDYKTQAILLSDDDVYYHPSDLEFAFQTWRKFGRDRLVGGLARCAWVDEQGDWRYNACDSNLDVYSMIITNLAFSHIKFLDYYTSANDSITTAIRQQVDENFNCEDIGMNYIATTLTQNPPLLVRGHKDYFNFVPKNGISERPGHAKMRNRCLNNFAALFGCMPLINETARIERGVVVREV